MKKIYYVQRGTFNDVKGIDKNLPLTGSQGNGLITLDYMGSAEFEFNAVPYSYSRIMKSIDDHILNFKIIDEIKNVNGVPLCLICKEEDEAEAIQKLKGLLIRYDPSKVTSDPLKSRISFHRGYYKSWQNWSRMQYDENLKTSIKMHIQFYNPNSLRDNFWWDIRTGNDIMFFWGLEDRLNLVRSSIIYDNMRWWTPMSDEEKDKRLKGNWPV